MRTVAPRLGTASPDGSRFAAVFIDAFSRYKHVVPIKTKDLGLDALQEGKVNLLEQWERTGVFSLAFPAVIAAVLSWPKAADGLVQPRPRACEVHERHVALAAIATLRLWLCEGTVNRGRGAVGQLSNASSGHLITLPYHSIRQVERGRAPSAAPW